MSAETLEGLFGSFGEHYWRLAHGQDDRLVVPDREVKSISHETTFAEDIAESEVLQAWLAELAEQVARRLRRHELNGRTVELKVRFADFHTITRSLTLAETKSPRCVGPKRVGSVSPGANSLVPLHQVMLVALEGLFRKRLQKLPADTR